MESREVMRRLNAAGWEVVAIKGSQHQFRIRLHLGA
jgi:predicted RNA binding protein YcfA (HicA-like mRNA interferase family)